MKVNTNTVKNQAGFSLVELMVVVAIIGILAAVAVPQFQNFQAKARQSESKTLLSSLYTAEQTLFGEFNTYHENFGIVPFKASGTLRYNIGFGAASGALIADMTAAGWSSGGATTLYASGFQTTGFCGGINTAAAAPAATDAGNVSGALVLDRGRCTASMDAGNTATGANVMITNGGVAAPVPLSAATGCAAALNNFVRVGAGTAVDPYRVTNFIAESRSGHNRARSGVVDIWLIDDAKNMVNCQPGVL